MNRFYSHPSIEKWLKYSIQPKTIKPLFCFTGYVEGDTSFELSHCCPFCFQEYKKWFFK